MSQIPIFRETCSAADESSGIFRQFSHPTGWLGWWIGQIVAVTNRTQSEWVLESISVQPDDYILEMGFGAGTDITLVSALAIHGFVAGIDRLSWCGKLNNEMQPRSRLNKLNYIVAVHCQFLTLTQCSTRFFRLMWCNSGQTHWQN